MTFANELTKNINAHTYEELAPYIGQHVAWSEDGTKVLCADPVFANLMEKLRGLDPATYILDYFPPPPVVLRGEELVKFLEAEFGCTIPPDALLSYAIRLSEGSDYPLNIQLANDYPGTAPSHHAAGCLRSAESDSGPVDAG